METTSALAGVHAGPVSFFKFFFGSSIMVELEFGGDGYYGGMRPGETFSEQGRNQHGARM